jgi:hypothetical protein
VVFLPCGSIEGNQLQKGCALGPQKAVEQEISYVYGKTQESGTEERVGSSAKTKREKTETKSKGKGTPEGLSDFGLTILVTAQAHPRIVLS